MSNDERPDSHAVSCRPSEIAYLHSVHSFIRRYGMQNPENIPREFKRLDQLGLILVPIMRSQRHAMPIDKELSCKFAAFLNKVYLSSTASTSPFVDPTPPT
jgi:hypothetical protein